MYALVFGVIGLMLLTQQLLALDRAEDLAARSPFLIYTTD